MNRSYGRVGAACACLFLAGCTLDSFTLSSVAAMKDDGPVVSGSLDVVSTSAQKALGEMGLFVSVHHDADTVKLTSTTPAGKRFTLVLKARKTDHGDETTVNIRWEKDSDDGFWMQLAASLAVRPAVTSAPPALKDGLPR